MTAVPTIGVIETEYAGTRFRSRLEARWAVFFDLLGLAWQHEPEAYRLGSSLYLPDFWLPELEAFWEVKPDLDADQRKPYKLHVLTEKSLVVGCGSPADAVARRANSGIGVFDQNLTRGSSLPNFLERTQSHITDAAEGATRHRFWEPRIGRMTERVAPILMPWIARSVVVETGNTRNDRIANDWYAGLPASRRRAIQECGADQGTIWIVFWGNEPDWVKQEEGTDTGDDDFFTFFVLGTHGDGRVAGVDE